MPPLTHACGRPCRFLQQSPKGHATRPVIVVRRCLFVRRSWCWRYFYRPTCRPVWQGCRADIVCHCRPTIKPCHTFGWCRLAVFLADTLGRQNDNRHLICRPTLADNVSLWRGSKTNWTLRQWQSLSLSAFITHGSSSFLPSSISPPSYSLTRSCSFSFWT